MIKRIFLCCALFTLNAYSAPEIKGTPNELKNFLHPNDKVISIRGQAEQTAYSDKAIVSVVVTTEARKLSEAMASNSNLRNTLTEMLVAQGIELKNINSSKFSTSPEYGWFGSKPSSYKVINRMSIGVTEEKHLNQLAAITDKYDEADLSDTAFEHTEKDAYKQRVKQQALDKIMVQKSFYERTLGLKLKAIGVRDIRIQQRATLGAENLERLVVNAARVNKKEKESYSSDVASPKSRTPSFDEVKYEANLMVDFKIVD